MAGASARPPRLGAIIAELRRHMAECTEGKIGFFQHSGLRGMNTIALRFVIGIRLTLLL